MQEEIGINLRIVLVGGAELAWDLSRLIIRRVNELVYVSVIASLTP